jgi:hypothetical protein
MRESHVGCVLGLIGVTAFSAGLALVGRKEWRLSTWTLLLAAVGATLMALGSRIWLDWFIRTYGDAHVPTWLGSLILSGLLAAFLLYVLFQRFAH